MKAPNPLWKSVIFREKARLSREPRRIHTPARNLLLLRLYAPRSPSLSKGVPPHEHA
jgi:hypothetical protein